MHPPHFILQDAIRSNVFDLPAYVTSTSDEFEPRASILLDANENALGSPFSQSAGSKCDQSYFDSRSLFIARQDKLSGFPQAGEQTADGSEPIERVSGFYGLQDRTTIPIDDAAPGTRIASTNDSQDRLSELDNGDMASSVSSLSMTGLPAGDGDMLASLHRYPSAAQLELKRRIADWKGLKETESVCLGIGAADLIDAIIRVSCTPSKEFILTTPPTFGLYRARAMLNEVGIVECPLKDDEDDFVLDTPQLLETVAKNPHIKLIFLASPGNPTGSLIKLEDIRTILSYETFKGILVVDEAYIDFCPDAQNTSAINMMSEFANLVIIQTMSKTLGLAGLRLGMAFGHPSVIRQLHKIQMPYCVSTPTTMIALRALSSAYEEPRIKSLNILISNREKLVRSLESLRVDACLGLGTPLGNSQANFVVLPIFERQPGVEHRRDNARAEVVTMRLKKEHSISVRFIGDLHGCEGCMRVTVGTEWENGMFVKALEALLAVC